MTSAYHAKYFAHELTKRCPSDSVAKLAASLADAQVDLNPHQIDAALFAFRSPLSKGALLADEVGLGKTIEAGILLSQKWAEQKRKLLIIVPANLRKQWSQELADKFFLPSVILETKSFNACIKTGNLNPFDQKEIIICSYHFARAKDTYVRLLPWDLVIVDEAHRLRNVYKPANRIANAIKNAIAHAPKVLLTATPLQNTLLELYGLVSIVDDLVFGDLKSFKAQFCTIRTEEDYQALRERLKTVCQRTLRRQVLEYIQYTNRFVITEKFVPTPEEQRLYDLVSDYLQRENLYALPSGQRKLMTLILRKLLASSTYAISGTLGALSSRLEIAARDQTTMLMEPEEMSSDYETIDENEEEWSEEGEGKKQKEPLTSKQLVELEQERQTLIEFKVLADSIVKNSKGEALLAALRSGFAKAKEFGAPEKAIIFTESTRTQQYLLHVLEASPHAGKVVLFNGSNNDIRSREIYKAWMQRHQGTDLVSGSPSADMRAALVDYFREEATIMVATEAAAEGINTLQREMEAQIDARMIETRQKLLENFDEEVQEKLRVQLRESTEALGRYEQWLWALTRYFLRECAKFSDDEKSFQLISNPFPGENIHPGPYKTGKHVEDVNIYRVGHPLAQRIIEHCKSLDLPPAEIHFDYSSTVSQHRRSRSFAWRKRMDIGSCSHRHRF